MRIDDRALRDFSRDVLAAAGAAAEDAKTVADALAWADLRGRQPQGVKRLPMLVDRLARGLIVSPAEMTWTAAGKSAASLDAGNAFGHVAGSAAMTRAVELAREQGVGAVAVRRSNLYGAASYFCFQAAAEGCLGFSCTNAVAKVAPFGGTRAVMGTNPLAFACPTRSKGPILVDLSTSAFAGSEIREMAERGEPLPPDTALDESGKPTTDARDVGKGCLLPAAGPKGFALGLMVEILAGCLSGAAMGREVGSIFSHDRPTNTGHFFFALDVTKFQAMDDFLDRVELLLSWIQESNGSPESVRFPGENRARFVELYLRHGVPLCAETLALLESVSDRTCVPVPWERTDRPGTSEDPTRHPAATIDAQLDAQSVTPAKAGVPS